MGVLTAVFPNARHITLDVAWVLWCVVKWWCEKENQSLGTADKFIFNSTHGARRTAPFSGPAHDSPGLRDRVDLAFRVFRRAERCAIIEVRAAIPFPVPTVAFERRL